MISRLSLSMMMVAWSVAPAMASMMASTGGGSDTEQQWYIIKVISQLIHKVAGLF